MISADCTTLSKSTLLYSIRVVLDRTSSDLDRALRHLDPDMFYPSADSVVPDLPVHANTNSHNSKLSPQRSLTQLLSDIQACRWKFFHLRPLQDNSRCEDKKGTPQVEKGGATPLSNSVSGEASELNRIQKVNQLNYNCQFIPGVFNKSSLSIIFNVACQLILIISAQPWYKSVICIKLTALGGCQLVDEVWMQSMFKVFLAITQLHYFHTFSCVLDYQCVYVNSLPVNEYSDKDISHSKC